MNRFSVVRFAVASFLVLSSVLVVQTFAQPSVTDVTLIGRVTCSRCIDLSQHKGFTPWTWASYKVSQGDNIVFVASGKTYYLRGDRQQLSKYLEDKVTVSGHLEAFTIQVTNIARPQKEK